MGTQEIIKILRDYKNECGGEYHILSIGIFGSMARGEAGDESDVDVVVRISEPDLFMLAGIKYDLEERLHRPVDIVNYNNYMNRFLKKRIDREAIYA